MDKVDEECPLHEAAAAGLSDECEKLVVAGKDVDSTDQLGWTPLMHAVHNRHFLLAKTLLSLGAKISIENHHGITVFTLAVILCNDDFLDTLYQGLEHPDLQQRESNNGLQVACVWGVYSSARWLLTNTNVDINHISRLTGVTPLHTAVICQHFKLADLLIRFGADATIPSALGQDVYQLARESGNRKLLQILNKDISPTHELSFHFTKDISNPKFDCIDSQYTRNNIYLNLQEDVVLKNSPCRPVFKSCQAEIELNSSNEQDHMHLLSPSLNSVFLISPQSHDKCLNQSWSTGNHRHDLQALISPCVHHLKSPSRGKKRKLLNSSGCSSWLKRLTKRRSRSVDDDLENAESFENSFNYDFLKPNGIDLSHLLFNLGLEEFFPTFRGHELDIWTFLTLTREDLDGLGINDPESQDLILKRIQILKKTHL